MAGARRLPQPLYEEISAGLGWRDALDEDKPTPQSLLPQLKSFGVFRRAIPRVCPLDAGKFDDGDQLGLPVAFNGSDGAAT